MLRESCYFNSLHLAFILPPLNHEWFDIQRLVPITAEDSSWYLPSTFHQFSNSLLSSHFARPIPSPFAVCTTSLPFRKRSDRTFHFNEAERSGIIIQLFITHLISNAAFANATARFLDNNIQARQEETQKSYGRRRRNS